MRSSQKFSMLCLVLVALTLVASGCSRSVDTTQVSTQDAPKNAALPTSTMLRAEAVTTTTVALATPSQASNALTAAPGSVPETLAAIVSQVSANPALLQQVSTLDPAGLAQLFNLENIFKCFNKFFHRNC